MERKSMKSKQLQGTVQKCRVKSTMNWQVLTEIPEPSIALDQSGMSYFNQFCQILLDNRTLSSAYIPIISRAARWYEIYTDADVAMRKHGAVQVTSTGYTQKSGYMTAMADADDRITKIEEKFGLNLWASQKIDVPKTEGNEFTTL